MAAEGSPGVPDVYTKAGSVIPHRWKILISSQVFCPKVGGIETVSRILAEEFAELGHDVTVLTLVEADGPDDYPYRVVRKPGPARLWREVAQCDIYWQNHIGLKTAWPALLLKKPWIVTLQGNLGEGIAALAKRVSLSKAVCISISGFVAAHNRCTSAIVGNPYDNRVFRVQQTKRSEDMIFVGRLVPEKGCTALLEALVRLRTQGLALTLTVVGDGPERSFLTRTVNSFGLERQVRFTGIMEGRHLAEALNAHKILVVPSVWEEPFGIVALEGIACGCAVVGFDSGGLRDAIGPCGVLVKRSDPAALAGAIARVLQEPGELQRLRAEASRHLAQFSRRTVALKYLQIFHTAACRNAAQCERPIAPALS